MKAIIFLISLLISTTSLAELTCSQKGTRLIYVNGIRTSWDEANFAMKAIYKLIPLNQLDKQGKVQQVLSYNYTYGFARDVLETIVQRFPQQFLKANSFKDGYAAYMDFMQGKLLGLVSPLILEDIVSSTKEAEAASVNLSRDTTTLVRYYQAALDDGFKVLAVSHSQGGLFMNDAYERLTGEKKEKFFAGLQIATPINSIVIPKFTYVTNSNDRVINLVRDQFGALPYTIGVFYAGNTFNNLGDVTDFFLNHGLLTTYLSDSTIKSQVIQEMINTAQLLESNCNIICNASNITSVMDFNFSSESSGEMFSLNHTRQVYNSGIPTQCECKTLELPLGKTYNLTVEGSIPNIGAIRPYYGLFTVNNQQELFFVNFHMTEESILDLFISRGAPYINTCDEYVMVE